MLKSLKNNKKKGFTLVELIVVLVILAILAALLIPALTGYIDKAKQKQIIAETRQVVMAAQTLVDEEYAVIGNNATITFEETTPATKVDGTVYVDEIGALSEVNLTWSATAPTAASPNGTVNITLGTTNEAGTIATVTYAANGMVCTYTHSNGEYNVK